jgi:hypothetical protein
MVYFCSCFKLFVLRLFMLWKNKQRFTAHFLYSSLFIYLSHLIFQINWNAYLFRNNLFRYYQETIWHVKGSKSLLFRHIHTATAHLQKGPRRSAIYHSPTGYIFRGLSNKVFFVKPQKLLNKYCKFLEVVHLLVFLESNNIFRYSDIWHISYVFRFIHNDFKQQLLKVYNLFLFWDHFIEFVQK